MGEGLRENSSDNVELNLSKEKDKHRFDDIHSIKELLYFLSHNKLYNDGTNKSHSDMRNDKENVMYQRGEDITKKVIEKIKFWRDVPISTEQVEELKYALYDEDLANAFIRIKKGELRANRDYLNQQMGKFGVK